MLKVSSGNRIVSVVHRSTQRTWDVPRWWPRWFGVAFVSLFIAGMRFANRPLAGYVSPNDDGKYDLIVDHDGPASYNNTGTFNTSGEQINASDFGLGAFEVCGADSLSSDGVNVIEVVLGATIAGATNLQPAPLAGQPGPATTTAVIHWFTSVTRSAEVANTTNLSGKFVRLRIVGV